MEDNFDAILTKLGTGKWNIFYYVVLAYWYACLTYHTLGGAFLAPKVGHTCRTPVYALTPKVILPVISEDLGHAAQNSTLYNPEDGQADKGQSLCTYLVHDNATGKVIEEECNAWDFDKSTFVSTVTSEFKLVCNWKYLRATYQSIYMFGILIGAGVNGYMADRFGRRTMIMIGSICYSIIAVGSAWLPNISTILIARFLLGTMHPTSLVTGYVLEMEITEPKRRAVIGNVAFLSWSVGTMLWGAWAYLNREWRWLQLAVSLPCFLFLPTLWIMDESLRWLIVTGRHEEAVKVLQKAARWNNVELPPKEKLLTLMKKIHEELGSSRTSEDKTSMKTKLKQWLCEVIILVRTPKLRLITACLCVDLFVVAMVFFGLNLSGGSFKVDPFIFIAIAGLVELPSNTISVFISVRFGRKWPVVVTYFIAGVAMLIQTLIPKDYTGLVITTVMIGKMSITMAFSFVGLFASELFPTEVRSRGMGAIMMSSRAGAIVSPFLMSSIGVDYPWTTPVVFGLASIIASLATLPLSDTQDSVLSDTVAHLEGHINPAMEEDDAL